MPLAGSPFSGLPLVSSIPKDITVTAESRVGILPGVLASGGTSGGGGSVGGLGERISPGSSPGVVGRVD